MPVAKPIPDASLDPGSPVPLYHQLFLILAEAIRSGEVRSGEYLPAEREIAERFGVGRVTATRALKELALSGMVSREQGRGTRVNFIAEAVVRRGPMATSATPRSAEGLSGYDAVLTAFDYLAPPPAVAEALGLDGGEVQRSVRILRFGGEAYAHIVASVPAAIGRRWPRAALAAAPLGVLIEEAGIAIVRTEERVSARLADAELAAALGLAAGAPLLEVVRTGFDSANRAVEHAVCRYVPDRYSYSVVARA